MTTFINQITTILLSSDSHLFMTDGIAGLVALILLGLLVEVVLIEAYDGKPTSHKTRAFTVVILPLVFVMSVVVFLRVAQILPL